ncbi:cell division protein SepF [Paenibacillus larvae]|uniref:Cell division protein SepF n=2 Tax=Paenibacillus larvae TaxID=1464 RepID=A0A2L1TM06_9BACL|nr:cell division protein SepF [Paenibacillus larvae]AQR77314.1 cell division protein SepF [Paenibacillus larvae subsp. larvae]AQT83850.1 cell division protein SepF [Paenibacillus larvae subsp. pulvifaciens]AQZ45290.1 cell division protein SepF [Paenibacillus larvae subsp. pulvifaciens]AVF21689.1 cell division protein SepF [Paenibacillus larvae subsp. larvae]AVF27235.1 cell division protein SepF [Paenibacillus larvae subsp. larvae]
MGVMNRVMNFLGLQEEEEVIEREPVKDKNGTEESETHVQEPLNKQHKGNVVSIHSQKNTRVVLQEPRSFDDSQEIADHLRSRKSVIVNLQRVRPEQAMRIFDFLNGTVYALNGSISKLGPNIFLCAPDSVEIQGSISDLMSEG